MEATPTTPSARVQSRPRAGSGASGRTSLNIISDGTIKIDGGVMFGQIPKGQWQDWMPADRRNRVKLGLNCLLVRVGEQNFLVDTGAGQKQSVAARDLFGLSTSQLLTGLKNHDLAPQDIHGVILTTLHFEHSGGGTRINRRGEIVPTFPKAQYYVQRAAYEEALSPTERHVDGFAPEDFLPLQERERLELLDGNEMIAPGLHVRLAPGPCLGHQIVVMTHGGERVGFLGDLVPTPYHLQLPCISATDRQPEETLQRKREILGEAVKEGWLLVFSHGVNERAGYLENRSGRLYLRPVRLD